MAYMCVTFYIFQSLEIARFHCIVFAIHVLAVASGINSYIFVCMATLLFHYSVRIPRKATKYIFKIIVDLLFERNDLHGDSEGQSSIRCQR